MKLDEDTVHAIGVWIIRILLVIGAIVAVLMGKDEAATTMGILVIVSFFFL